MIWKPYMKEYYFLIKAVRSNYESEEKVALITHISMIKDLASILNSMELKLQPLINSFIAGEIQAFVNGNITEYYNSATKKKKASAP